MIEKGMYRVFANEGSMFSIDIEASSESEAILLANNDIDEEDSRWEYMGESRSRIATSAFKLEE